MPTDPPVDPLSVPCPYCRVPPGERCINTATFQTDDGECIMPGFLEEPHRSRRNLAAASPRPEPEAAEETEQC